jgi:hypothetical protein
MAIKVIVVYTVQLDGTICYLHLQHQFILPAISSKTESYNYLLDSPMIHFSP